jgi:hypothetical protein
VKIDEEKLKEDGLIVLIMPEDSVKALHMFLGQTMRGLDFSYRGSANGSRAWEITPERRQRALRIAYAALAPEGPVRTQIAKSAAPKKDPAAITAALGEGE